MQEKELNLPVGYQYLKEHLKTLKIETFPYYRESYIRKKGVTKIKETPEKVTYYYQKNYQQEDNIFSQLEFAIRNEGFNFDLIEKLFQIIPESEVINYINKSPKSKYTRIIWFLYEWLTENKLDIPDLPKTNYINLLDEKLYFTSKPNKFIRYYLNENLLGNRNFCPFVRKSNTLKHYDEIDLKDKISKTIDSFDVSLIKRASSYLYYKETKSSNEIEREKPSQARTARFVNILERINQLDDLSKELLLEIQNTIVDPRYAQDDYRTLQNYVGETLGYEYQKVHYISPKGEDVELLMQGLLDCYDRLKDSDLPPVLIAAVLSFGFVFIHPFEDGNGRLHRFLIHYVLSKAGLTPSDIIFPISSTILNNLQKYDECLENFSKPLTQLINYDIDAEGKMTVYGSTDNYYKFIDMTKMVEYLYSCIFDTIEVSFVEELKFLANFDNTKKEMQEVVDMPDQKVNLFITLCKQNNGKLSENKRKSQFEELTNKEVQELEEIYNKYFKF